MEALLTRAETAERTFALRGQIKRLERERDEEEASLKSSAPSGIPGFKPLLNSACQKQWEEKWDVVGSYNRKIVALQDELKNLQDDCPHIFGSYAFPGVLKYEGFLQCIVCGHQ